MSAETSDVLAPFRERVARLERAARAFTPSLAVREHGVVAAVGQGIAEVDGLPGVLSEEVVILGHDVAGLALDLRERRVGVALLDEAGALAAGDPVRRTGRVLDVPVGTGLVGRVIDPLGRPRDGRGPLESTERLPAEREAPPIMDRAPVSVPLETGIKVVDALIPVGRGQRQLVVGDRQTGKTAVAVDAILNQRGRGVVCVYCAIGQRAAGIARVVAGLRGRDALAHTCVVATTEDDPPGLRYAAPYAAMSIAESFMARGRDTLVVLDDLTRHARAYRELSLLMRRPPGREAYPGDIFFLHARMLERSTHLRDEHGGGSLTALPIVQTEAEDISAYIPTNLISITDGQIYLSPRLFQKGVLPAVDVGRSVSRVGGKTQYPAYRAVAGHLRLSYSQFEELESFARFSARLDEETRATLERGRRIREVLKQPQFDPWPAADQVAALLVVDAGVLDAVPLERVAEAADRVRAVLAERHAEIARAVPAGERLDERAREALLASARETVADLAAVGEG